MSNWGTRHLTLDQISYAARDAWVSAAVVEQLQMCNNDVFRVESLMDMDFMKNQRSMDDMDARAKARKAAKLELKEITEGQMMKTEVKGEDEEERMRVLQSHLDLYRPDQPPAFSKDILNMPLL
jgi:ribonuclease D